MLLCLMSQVIGQVQFAHVLAERTYLIIGTGGMLIVGDSDKIMQCVTSHSAPAES